MTEAIGTLYYFGDPMCSWCWGFKPVLEQVEAEYPELKRITVMGGLRGADNEPMSKELIGMIKGAWLRIEKSTGQPFNHQFWDRHRPLASTLPACRAVMAARLLNPEYEWSFMVGMFKAYFTQTLDPTHRKTYLHVAESVGYDLIEFNTKLDSPEVDETLQKDLILTQQFGITGFPTVVLTIEGNNFLVSPGYQPIEGMRRAINTIYEKAGIEFTRPESGLYS